MNLAKLSIKRPTFIFAILIAALVLGVMAFSKLSVRMFPDVEFPYVAVITSYPGAGVAEIDQLVSKPIEDAMSGVSGLKHVTSMNQDNISVVFAEFELSKNPDIAAQEVRDKIGQIRLTLPDDVDEPIIMKADMNSMPLVILSLKSDTLSPKELYDFADDVVSKDFAQVAGVSQISIVGGQKREIQVKANKDKLKEHEITLTALAARIQANSLNIPAGKIDRGSKEIAFRTMGEFTSVDQIGNVVVSFMGNDVPVTVKDVAQVVDGVQSETSRARLDTKEDGKISYESSLLVQVFRQAKGNDVAVSDGVQLKLDEVNKKYQRYAGKPHLTLISDSARGVRLNIADVKNTIVEGIFLAILVVYFFLGSWRSTFITALALPNSLIGSFIFMYAFGFSLNVISLMSLSLAVGLLIDDAIVVRENIFRHYEEGEDPVKAAINGTNEVTLAVIATTSTVIAVFLPVSFLSGIMGQFFREFGLTVVFAMAISILDALTIAPMLSAYFIPDKNKKAKKRGEFSESVKRVFARIVKVVRFLTVDWFNIVFNAVERFYTKTISFIVKTKGMKLITLGASAVIVFIVIGLVAAGALKVNFMPNSDWGEFNVSITARPGTSLEQMDKYTREVEEVIMNEPDVELVSASVGSTGMWSSPTNEASLYVKMYSKDEEHNILKKYAKAFIGIFQKESDKRSTSQMKDYLRDVLQKKYGDELTFQYLRQSIGGAESEFVVELTGDNVDVLYSAAQNLMERFKTIPHLVDIKSNYQPGKPEMQIQMDMKNMESLGVNSVIAGNEIRAMVDGATAGKYRENGLEYDIRVKFRDDQKDVVKDFDTIYVNNVNNKLVRLKNVAFVRATDGPTQIFKKDRARYVTVEGNISEGGTISEVQSEAFKIFKEEKYNNPKTSAKFKNVEMKVSGNAEEMGTMVQSIAIAALLSLLFIFMVLSSLYESVVTPFTIMTALPLAIVGAIFSLIIARQPADMFTLIGMIMLLGIVAKNSILLVDYIQQQIRAGFDIDTAIVKAGTIRFRPILMTSFALIAGMLPTALGLSEVGSFRKGMGIVVIGGIISSTVLTLVVVPAIFEYMDIFRHFLRRIFGRPDTRMVDLTDEELKTKDL
ncbi:efflux RND transporter permease subunit [Endomicrobium proavitum]|uniref:NolG efflux transporter n=1 Tax=Endomicrobium proavitum TaxID=1408281 RepID=A0A0G3WJQ2_9BACT|nr:efflux RND transporter permease subunit [Endomicrobium proavitum]AKL98092.1 NolG efflux transporter [Endomicrobium proavitum]